MWFRVKHIVPVPNENSNNNNNDNHNNITTTTTNTTTKAELLGQSELNYQPKTNKQRNTYTPKHKSKRTNKKQNKTKNKQTKNPNKTKQEQKRTVCTSFVDFDRAVDCTVRLAANSVENSAFFAGSGFLAFG